MKNVFRVICAVLLFLSVIFLTPADTEASTEKYAVGKLTCMPYTDTEGGVFIDIDDKQYPLASLTENDVARVALDIAAEDYSDPWVIYRLINGELYSLYPSPYAIGKLTASHYTDSEGKNYIKIDDVEYSVADNDDNVLADSVNIATSANSWVVYRVAVADGSIEKLYPFSELVEGSIKVTADPAEIVYEDGEFNKNTFKLKIEASCVFGGGYLEYREEIPEYIWDKVLDKAEVELLNLNIVPQSSNLSFSKTGWFFEEEVEEINDTINEAISATSIFSHTYKYTVHLSDNFVPSDINSFIKMECVASFDTGTTSRDVQIAIGNLDLQKERAAIKKATTKRGKNLANIRASLNSNKVVGITTDPTLREYLTGSQIKEINDFLNIWIGNLFAAPTHDECKLDEKVRDKVIGKLGIKKSLMNLLSSSETVASVDVLTDTEQGEKRIHFTVKLNGYNINEDGIPTAGFGVMNYVVYDLESDEEECTGYDVPVTYADIEAFAKCLQTVADDAIKDAYNDIWGKSANKIAKYLTEGTIVSALQSCGYFGTFSDHVYDLITAPTKHYLKINNHCPVDINVYDSDGNLCGAIKDNKVDTDYNELYMYTDGDSKHFYLFDDNYRLEFIGNDTGSMDYEVEEYDEDGQLLRTIYYEDIPLKDGQAYQAAAPEASSFDSSLYDVVASDGAEITASSDTQPQSERKEPITWCLMDDGTLYVYGHGKVHFDKEWEKKDQVKKVVFLDGEIEIVKDSFEYCSNLESVEMNDAVTSVGYGSFYDCDKLTTVSTVADIQKWAFALCDNLEEISIKGRTALAEYDYNYIQEKAFYGCASLDTITFSGEKIKIREDAFIDCDSLQNVEFASGVVSIGNNAFSDCDNLRTVSLSETVEGFGMRGDTLETIKVSGSNPYFAAVDGVLFNKDKTCLWTYPAKKSDKNYAIPQGVETVCIEAFYGADQLINITIPEGITNIGARAFYKCGGLENMTIPKCVASIDLETFYGCSNLSSVTIQGGVTSIGESAFHGCDSLESVAIPDGVTSIGESAFHGCDSLESVIIPDGVTSIEEETFSGCSKLYSVTIPESIVTIKGGAFYGCSSLQSIALPSNLTSIDGNMFYGAFEKSGLESIVIPPEVASIGMKAFDGCSSLESVTIPDGVTSIGESAFRECENLRSVTVPKSVAEIGESAFQYCRMLDTVVLQNGLKTIGDHAFDCVYVEISIPDSVESIGGGAFCTAKNITVSSGNSQYMSEDGVLFDKDKIKLLQYPGSKRKDIYMIPEGITEIGDYAFCSSSLTSIILPDTVKTIGDYSFDSDALERVGIPAGVTSIGYNPTFLLPEVIYGDKDSYMHSYAEENEIRFIPRRLENIVSINIGDDEGRIYFDKTEGTLTEYVAYTGNLSMIVNIPKTIQGVEVTSIWNCAFMRENHLSEVWIPDGVIEIGDFAFYECNNLDEIYIPSNVDFIGREAFGGCEYLTINAPRGSYAETYAKENNIPFIAYGTAENEDTQLPGDSYYDSKDIENPIDISKETVILSATSYTYNGSARKPSVTISGLKEGSDFTVSYKNNTNPGTATVTITGKGNYTGTITKTFTIKSPSVASLKSVPVRLAKGDYDAVYASWSKVSVPGATVKYKVQYKVGSTGWKEAASGMTKTSYTIKALADGKKCYVKVTPYVTVNKKTYSGSAKASTAIYTLKKLNKPTVKKASKTKIKVSWKNISGESGYEVYKSTKKSSGFKLAKRVTSTTAKSTTFKVAKKKTYYYKVRAFKTIKISGKNYRVYGPWSAVKSYKLK